MSAPENDWIEHSGGECPLPPETRVQVRYRDGETEILPRASCVIDTLGGDWWKHEGESVYIGGVEEYVADHSCDIIAYRVVPA